MAKRGRKPKPKLDIEDQLDEAIGKYMMKMPLTLEETALLIWQIEGRKTSKPLTKPRMKAIENTAMSKLRTGLQKMGITKLDDVYNVSKRSYARCTDHVEQ